MPRAANTRPDKSKVYRAWQSFAALVDGKDVIVTQGERLRGDLPVVAACFSQFVEDGAPRSEWPTSWADALDRDEALQAAEAAEAKCDVHLAAAPQVYERVDVLIALEPLTVGVGCSSNASVPIHYLEVEKGALVHRTDPLVVAKPDCFGELDWTPKKKPARKAAR